MLCTSYSHRRHVMVEEVIRAKRFEVIDDAGRPRVIVGTQEEASGLMLLDGNGQNVAELAVSDEMGSTTLSLYDLRGSLRARPWTWTRTALRRWACTIWRESRESQLGSRKGTRPYSTSPAPTVRRECPSRWTRTVCRASSSWTATGTTASRSESTGGGTRTWSSSTPTAGRFDWMSEAGI